jgi:hypothetical protein
MTLAHEHGQKDQTQQPGNPSRVAGDRPQRVQMTVVHGRESIK